MGAVLVLLCSHALYCATQRHVDSKGELLDMYVMYDDDRCVRWYTCGVQWERSVFYVWWHFDVCCNNT